MYCAPEPNLQDLEASRTDTPTEWVNETQVHPSAEISALFAREANMS